MTEAMLPPQLPRPPALEARPPASGVASGIAFMCLAAFLWALMETLGRRIPASISPYQVVWTRYAAHLLLMTRVLTPRLVRTRRWRLQVGRALLMLVMPVCFVKAAARLPAPEVWAAFWLAPLLLLALAWLLLRERPTGRDWALGLAGLAGCLLVTHPGPDSLRPELLFALGMAGCFSLYLALTRLMRDESIFTNLFYTAFCVFCMMSLFVPFVWRWPSTAGWLVMSAIGIIGYFSLFSFEKALERAPLPVLAPFLFTQLAWVAIMAWILFDDRVGALSTFGISLIIGVGVYAFWSHQHCGSRSSPSPATGPPSGADPGAA